MMVVAGGGFIPALSCGAVGWQWVGSLMVRARLGLCPVGVGDVCWEWGCVGGLGLAGRRRFAVAWGDRLVLVMVWVALVDVVVVVGQAGMSVC